MSEYYWELVQHDGTRIEIPPEAVGVVKRRMEAGSPINMKTAVVPANQIKFFRQTDKPYGRQPLLEAVAGAFSEPMVNEDGSIVSKWVKRYVTQSKWDKHYAPSGYRRLGDESGMVLVAFKLPVHEIDVNNTPYCTPDEIAELQKKY